MNREGSIQETKTPVTCGWTKGLQESLFGACPAVWLSIKPFLDISIFHEGQYQVTNSVFLFNTRLLFTRRDMLRFVSLHTASIHVSGLAPECCVVITLLIRSKIEYHLDIVMINTNVILITDLSMLSLVLAYYHASTWISAHLLVWVKWSSDTSTQMGAELIDTLYILL